VAAERVAEDGEAPRQAGAANAPRLARSFVLLFLAAMAAAAIFTWEPWPITSFRLFSHLRQDQQHGWAAVVTGTDGEETPLAIAGPAGDLRNFGFRMAEFETTSWQRRDEICRAWLAPLQERGGAEIRLYRLRWRLSRRIENGDRAAPPSRKLAFVCRPAGVRGPLAG
jgi:hypothetical protein